MRSWTFTAAALFLLTLTGCSHRGEALPPAATSTTTTTTTTTTSTTTTTPPPPTAAADGRNLQACQDGTCEVVIQSGDLLTVRGETLTIVSVAPDGVTFVLPSGTVASLYLGTITTGSGTTIDILTNSGTSAIVRVS